MQRPPISRIYVKIWPMAISEQEIRHIAALAKLDFKDEEDLKFLQGRLESIIDFAKIVQSLDTNSVNPTNQVTGLLNVFRDDVVKPYPEDRLAKMFSQVPNFRDGYVVVPHAIKRLK